MNTEEKASVTKVSVIVPMCNEEDSLETLGKSLGSLKERLGSQHDLTVVFVDDGCTDRTVELLPRHLPPHLSYLVTGHRHNRGIGAALKTGLSYCREADIVCMIDADCTYAPDNLVLMMDEVVAGRTDVIVASPYHPRGTVEGVQPWRLLLSRQCSRLYRIVSPLKLHTYTSIFRVYSGAAAQHASSRGDDFVAAVELLLTVSQRGFRVSEMPLTLCKRTTGISKMRILKTIRGHARLMAACVRAGKQGYTVPSRLAAELPGAAPSCTDAAKEVGVR